MEGLEGIQNGMDAGMLVSLLENTVHALGLGTPRSNLSIFMPYLQVLPQAGAQQRAARSR